MRMSIAKRDFIADMKILAKPRAVIFDWDNTLVDTWPLIHAALVETLVKFDKEPWTLEQTKARVAKSMRDSFPELFGNEWERAAQFYQERYRGMHLQQLSALPQAEELVKRVHALGLYSVVVSNKKGPSLRLEVDHMHWRSLFDEVVGADDAARDKPFSDPVLLAFEKSDIELGEHVWFFGDSAVDLECAKATGCTAILYGEEARAQPDCDDTSFRGFPFHAYVATHGDSMRLLETALKR